MSKKKQGSTGAAGQANSESPAQAAIPFERLEVSRWNRSYGLPLDDQYIKELAGDIKKHGLLHQLTLVQDGQEWKILAGAHRFEALKLLPDQKGEIKPNQYRVIPDLTERDEQGLDISLAENHHRRPSAVIENARYAVRLIDDQKIEQKRLAKKLKTSETTISRMRKLVQSFGQLPQVWQTDLSNPKQAEGDEERVTFAHWVEVAPRIEKQGVTPELVQIMEQAKAQKMSSRALRDALKSAPGVTPAPTRKPKNTKVEPQQVLKSLVKKIENAMADLRGKRDDLVKTLNGFRQTIEGEIQKLSAPAAKPDKDVPVKTKNPPGVPPEPAK